MIIVGVWGFGSLGSGSCAIRSLSSCLRVRNINTPTTHSLSLIHLSLSIYQSLNRLSINSHLDGKRLLIQSWPVQHITASCSIA